MEDDLKILKVEYLSNHLSDLPQNFRYFYRRVSLRLVGWVVPGSSNLSVQQQNVPPKDK
jgi:hypothetical protein